MSAPAISQTEPATLAELVARDAKTSPTRTALIFEERTYSFAELDATIEAAADAFANAGVTHGDRVALMCGNTPLFIAAYYGALRLGAVVVPVNPMYRRTEIEHILRDSEPSAALVEGDLWAEVADAYRSCDIACVAVSGAAPVAEPARVWEDLVRAAPPRGAVPGPVPTDLAALVYTSGTTGNAKGAMHSHATLLANTRQAGQLERRFVRADDRVLLVVPLCHMFGMQSGLNALFRVGGSVVLMRRFLAAEALAIIERYRCTFLFGAPPMFVRWVAMPELRSYDLSSLRVVSTGAAPLKASVLDTFREATGVSVSESYGLTEAGPTSHSNSAGPFDRAGTVGPVVTDVECRLVDETGRDVPIGEPGEILLRSPGLMLGYWRNPKATAETLRDGWLHTGDVAVVDADGYYTIVDRLKDMISAGGFKVWPLEVETALLDHPAIDDVAIVGIPHADSGERPMAFVVRAAGSALAAEDVVDFAQRSLAKYKAPVRVEFIDALPRSSTGKVLRRELRERARMLAV